MQFRRLKPNEIQARVKQVRKTDKGIWCMLLLYKDARCDMNILDETAGAENWQRKHENINGDIYCSVGIYDEKKGDFVWKQDCGTEGDHGNEVEKSRSSDSFKRACVCWGIGRELYTSPKIVFDLRDGEFFTNGDSVKINPKLTFKVDEITYTDSGNIEHLTIVDNKGVQRFKR